MIGGKKTIGRMDKRVVRNKGRKWVTEVRPQWEGAPDDGRGRTEEDKTWSKKTAKL